MFSVTVRLHFAAFNDGQSQACQTGLNWWQDDLMKVLKGVGFIGILVKVRHHISLTFLLRLL